MNLFQSDTDKSEDRFKNSGWPSALWVSAAFFYRWAFMNYRIIWRDWRFIYSWFRKWRYWNVPTVR